MNDLSTMTYTMSKDYDRLYDLLRAGGEALGKAIVRGPLQRDPDTVPVLLARISTGDWSMSHEYGWKMYGPKHKDSFIEECQHISLEWLAPVDLAAVLEAGDSMHDRLQETRIKVVNGTESYDDGEIMLDSEAQQAWTTATAKLNQTNG